MQWLEISVPVDAEVAEAVADVLNRYAPGGVAIELQQKNNTVKEETVVVKAYVPVGPETARAREQVEEALWHLGQISPIPAPRYVTVSETDWANAWKEHYHPLRVGQRIVVKPTWRDFDANSDDIIVELDPGMAFGTGLHPTTRLCLMFLEEQIRSGMTVLDLGTGSGILAVTAAKLGAHLVLALDTDPVAVAAARENVQQNDVSDRVTVAQGSLDQATDAYDLVVVNILAKVIIALAQEGLAGRVRPGGQWATAGIIETQAPEVVAALTSAGLHVNAQRQIADWVALMGCRPQEGRSAVHVVPA
jgi:ribosomal protein L11 methyltransferase